MSLKEISDVYVHKSEDIFDKETYLKECINKRLLPPIDKYLWKKKTYELKKK
jgi:hypothetical protein